MSVHLHLDVTNRRLAVKDTNVHGYGPGGYYRRSVAIGEFSGEQIVLTGDPKDLRNFVCRLLAVVESFVADGES